MNHPSIHDSFIHLIIDFIHSFIDPLISFIHVCSWAYFSGNVGFLLVTKLAEGAVLMDEISSRVFHSSRNKKPGFHYVYSVLLLPVSSAPVFVAVVVAFLFVFFAGKRRPGFWICKAALDNCDRVLWQKQQVLLKSSRHLKLLVSNWGI
jgi:hypothetical protein